MNRENNFLFLCVKTGNYSIFAEKKIEMAAWTVSREVRNKVGNFDSDWIFTLRDLDLPPCFAECAVKALNKMVREGELKKFSKGKFYKPKKSVFGELEPSREEILKDLLVKDGKRIGYMTGYVLFNKYALTTQVPNVIQIATNKRKVKIQRGIYCVIFVQQVNEITEETIPLLQLLDVIRMIKEIPDANVNRSCERLLYLLKDLPDSERDRLIGLAMNYNPGTRALTGAMIEKLWGVKQAKPLYDSLNPVTSYSLGIDETVLPTIKRWRIL